MIKKSVYYASSFGGIRLWISRLETDKSRSKTIHDPAAGDNHIVQDRGKVVLKATASLLFDYMRGDTLSPVERLNQFKALVDTPDSSVFTHPVEGSFSASVENFRYSLDDSGQITAECTFIADGVVSDAIPAGQSTIPATGPGAVDAAADGYTAECADANIPDEGIGDAAKQSVDAWLAGEASARGIIKDTGTYSTQLSAKVGNLTDSLETWQTFKSAVLLMDSIYSAGKAALSGTVTNFFVMVATNTPLRTLLAKEFGADQVDFRYQQVLDINDLATPGLIPSGTQLKLPSQPPKGRNG